MPWNPNWPQPQRQTSPSFADTLTAGRAHQFISKLIPTRNIVVRGTGGSSTHKYRENLTVWLNRMRSNIDRNKATERDRQAFDNVNRLLSGEMAPDDWSASWLKKYFEETLRDGNVPGVHKGRVDFAKQVRWGSK